ncbi:MAG: glycosyltransferase family 2 protein, partial [Nocardioides sp.]|nr:glycosyltransferase family 2 protein [Nocardioides sp.]
MTVTALLVSHDGDRWLPAVLAGLRDQQRRPDRFLAVDTGSSDGSLDLLRADLGAEVVHEHSGSFAEAIAHALPLIETEWVWILHDDANPHANALEALLESADDSGADILGPKLREWPDLKRLLELGVTISGAGRRETGLEHGEYDQGQHEQVRRVLAVNTAGMLVRRSVLEKLGGFDLDLPLFGNDIDFGWRAARAGHTTMIVPAAIVFHAEAAQRGIRHTTRMSRHEHQTERRAALHTLLANTVGWRYGAQWFRLLFGSFLRIVGFLLARKPRLARDEVRAVSAVYAHPGRIRSARKARAALGDEHNDDVRALLAPWWLPYRHGLDFVSDVGTAIANQGRDAAERRRARRAESGPVPDEAEELEADSSWLARLVTSPAAVITTLLVIAVLWGAREAFGPISGGALSPAPGGVSDWWTLVREGWHPLAQGTDAPAPAYLVPMALLG